MSVDKIEDGIQETLNGLSKIADNGGYVERKQALQTIAEMRWFDNFGIKYYNHRIRIATTLANSIKDKDIPETVKEDLEITTDD
jgi:hypothetical protein